MPKLNLKTLLAASALTIAGTTIAVAQDPMPEVVEPAPSTVLSVDDVKTHLAKADVDFDGKLDAEEYINFTVAMAEDGDDNSGALVVSGDYDAMFQSLDTDGDGKLTEDELHTAADDGAADEIVIDEEPEM
ncbi:EF-hand domain-containing protein [uncultured Algimonas sp.]|uniref:EF-hand domain-containing protein n=1 Tax=uncultured Algimonas sp. TaxID=1547920 RepID=UPI002617C6BE|nr:EF-hand domain-containing protein [uncultured Algimonas sp.]